MYKVVILPLAKRDIQETANWYEKRSRGMGKGFTNEVREKVLFIRQNPKAFNIRYKNVGTAVLNVLPFMIHYLVDEENQIIIILSVVHTSSNPKL